MNKQSKDPTTAPEREAASADATRVRREFLAKFGSGVFASLLAPALAGGALPALAQSPRRAPGALKMPDLPPETEGEDVVLRMMRELRRALAKPAAERRWSMVIDLRKCVGCHACTISCIAENKLPPGVVYRPVMEEELGKFPHVSRRFTPRPCMQCEKPSCTAVCPVSATWKRADGIVEIDYDQCIGCRYCLTACPYSARTFDAGHNYTDRTPENTPALVDRARAARYEQTKAHDYGKEWGREPDASPIGNARKCHFCVHRLEKGMLPECVTGCIGHATFFGDANDPDSLIAELIGRPNGMRLKEELGTQPKVHYLL